MIRNMIIIKATGVVTRPFLVDTRIIHRITKWIIATMSAAASSPKTAEISMPSLRCSK